MRITLNQFRRIIQEELDYSTWPATTIDAIRDIVDMTDYGDPVSDVESDLDTEPDPRLASLQNIKGIADELIADGFGGAGTSQLTELQAIQMLDELIDEAEFVKLNHVGWSGRTYPQDHFPR